MRYLLIFALALFPSVAFAADDALIDRYYELRADCRVGDDVSEAESDAACAEITEIGAKLAAVGYCWYKPEQEWRHCD